MQFSVAACMCPHNAATACTTATLFLAGVETCCTGKHDCANRLTKSPLCMCCWVCEYVRHFKTPRSILEQVWAGGDYTLAFNVAHCLAPFAAYCTSRWAELDNKCFFFPEEIAQHKQLGREIFLHSCRTDCCVEADLCSFWQTTRLFLPDFTVRQSLHQLAWLVTVIQMCEFLEQTLDTNR